MNTRVDSDLGNVMAGFSREFLIGLEVHNGPAVKIRAFLTKREVSRTGDGLETADPSFGFQPMNEAGDRRLHSDVADGGQPAVGQCRHCNIDRELCQRQPMPAEGSTFYLGHASRDLVCSAKTSLTYSSRRWVASEQSGRAPSAHEL